MTSFFAMVFAFVAVIGTITYILANSAKNRGREPKAAASDGGDAWEGSFWEVDQPIAVQARLRIDYVDTEGKRSERTILVRQYGGFESHSLLIARCMLRNATRTFRTDRIKRCVDEETGEIVRDIPAYLRAKYTASPERSADALLESEYDSLRILLYVGKADGQLRAAEKAVIRETCYVLSRDSRLSDEMIDDLFKEMDVPTLQAFKLAVGRVAGRDQPVRKAILESAKRIVNTQKTTHAAEKEALEYMQQRLS